MSIYNRKFFSSAHPKKPGSELIGRRIKEIRLARKLTITELAGRAGIAKSYLSNIERNLQSNPSIRFLEKLSRVLDVEVEKLLCAPDDGKRTAEDWAVLVREAEEVGVNREEFKGLIDYKRLINMDRHGPPGDG